MLAANFCQFFLASVKAQTVVNMVIWWGGLIGYGIYYQKKHPDAGFWDQFSDIWGWIVPLGLILVQFVVAKLFFRPPDR